MNPDVTRRSDERKKDRHGGEDAAHIPSSRPDTASYYPLKRATPDAGPLDPLGVRPVYSVRQSEMVPTSPASSPAVCIYWTKSWPRLQAGTPDIIPTRQLFSPTCHSAVSQHIRTCWRSLSEADGFCLLCLSSGVLVNGDGPTIRHKWVRGRARDAAQESNSAVNELPSKCTNLRADLVRVCWAAPWEICFWIVLVWFKGLWSLVLAHLAHQPRNRGVGRGGGIGGKGKCTHKVQALVSAT